MTERNFTIRALGEIAIRCIDKPAMVAFYRDTLGLTALNGEDGPITFFALGESFGGHTAVLALFAHDHPSAGGVQEAPTPPATGARSSLHHIALSLPYDEQTAVMAWYEARGLGYRVELFDWIGWRGIFTKDPDGNNVELVAKNPDWRAPA